MSDNCSYDLRIWHKLLIVVHLFSFVLITSCTGKFPWPIDEYYYPIDQLEAGIVYVYETQTNDGPAAKSYWLFQSNQSDNRTFLIGKNYSSTFELNQSFEQEIHESGILLNHYDLFIPVGEDRVLVPVNVIHNNVYPFQAKDTTTIYLYKLEYTNPQDSSSNIITRNRRFVKSGNWKSEDKNSRMIQLGLLEQIINEKNGTVTIDLKGFEIYVKNIGLVYSERISLDEKTKLVDRLIERIPLKEMKEILRD